MRLIELTVSNFRGFGTSSDPIRLDRDLILVYGPNGFGKTSLAEAIEWLFYGSTKRRLHGEGYSKAEYAGTYANAHNGKPVQVNLKVLIGSTEYLLSRRLIDGAKGELTETFIDGSEGSFASIGANGREAVYPVVSQHGLQTFIHSKPKDRRDAIGSALGLDELTTLKSSLETARASFQRTPPAPIVQARKDLAANLEVLALFTDTKALVMRWQKSPMQVQPKDDIAILLKTTASLCGIGITTLEEALTALRAKRTEASRAVFDASKIAPASTHADDATAFANMSIAAKGEFEEFGGALAGAIAALAATYNAVLLAFWRTGLGIAPSGEVCPMCETPNLTAIRRAELRKRIDEGGIAIASDKAFTAKTTALSTAIDSLKTAAVNVSTKSVTASERQLLRTLLSGSEVELDAFLAISDRLTSARETLDQAVKAASDFLRGVSSRVTTGAGAPKLLTDAEAVRDGVLQASAAFAASVISYHQQWPPFELILDARIATQGEVAKIDAVGKTLKLKPAMELHAKYDLILNETQEVIRGVEQTLQTKQTALLATRGGEVKTIYDLLNPGANVVFHGMEPGTDHLKLHATSFGVRMPAAANLSECQLNCLGLSVWIMQATTPGSPFDFIVLDDPVQSMDDDHSDAFIISLVPYLMETCRKQVIVLSHVERITDRLRELNTDKPIRHYHLSEFLHSGPTFIEQSRIAKSLSKIKSFSQGNDDNRERAVEQLRELIEYFIRELYLKTNGNPMPAQFDKASPRTLLGAFRSLSVTTAQENSGLDDSIGFTDPAHHTEVGYTTPVATRIAPHIARVEGLLKKYSLIT